MEVVKNLDLDSGYSVPAFVDELQTVFRKNEVHGKTTFEADAEYSTNKEAWKAILSELIDNNGNTSLSHFGLLGLTLDVIGSYKKYNLSETEFKSLCSIFAMSMMADAAVAYTAPLNENDLEDFTHGGVEYTFTLSDSNEKKHQKAFIPTRTGLSNKRVDYLQRILLKKGFSLTNDEAAEFLKLLWEKVLIGRSCLSRVEGNAYRIDTSKIRITKPKRWYICKKCNIL